MRGISVLCPEKSAWEILVCWRKLGKETEWEIILIVYFFLYRSNKNNVLCNIIHRVFKSDVVKISACKSHVKKCNDCKYLHM